VAVALNAIAMVAGVATAVFVAAAMVSDESGGPLRALAVGLLAVGTLAARALVPRLGSGRAALLAGGLLLAHALVQAFASPMAVGALTVSLLLAVATVLPYARGRALQAFLLATLATAIAVPLVALRSPHGQALSAGVRVLVSVTATGTTAGLVLLTLLQWRERIRQLLRLESNARDQAEQATAVLDTVFEAAPVGLAVVDRDLRYLRVNPALAEATGAPPARHLGRPVTEMTPELAPALEHGFTGAIEGVPITEAEIKGKTDAGPQPRDLIASYYPVRVRGQVVAAGAVIVDVTERKQVERELEQAIRVRDDFISVASHELKTPLTSLRLNLDSLLVTASSRDPICPQKLGRRLETVDRVTDRLQQLIEELLNITRLSSGHLGLTLAPLDFADVVDEVLARLGGQLADARCTVNTSLSRPVEGRWDRLRLDQIVSNLVSNAIKYGAGKPVDISLRADERDAVLVVRDRGIGIAPADQSRIFRRFERAVSTRSYGGLGIGLWLVERIVVALGGSITVASEPGQGAVFSVLLPLQGPPPSQDRAS
jgi:PAS domain S-box-containing protein